MKTRINRRKRSVSYAAIRTHVRKHPTHTKTAVAAALGCWVGDVVEALKQLGRQPSRKPRADRSQKAQEAVLVINRINEAKRAGMFKISRSA